MDATATKKFANCTQTTNCKPFSQSNLINRTPVFASQQITQIYTYIYIYIYNQNQQPCFKETYSIRIESQQIFSIFPLQLSLDRNWSSKDGTSFTQRKHGSNFPFHRNEEVVGNSGKNYYISHQIRRRTDFLGQFFPGENKDKLFLISCLTKY